MRDRRVSPPRIRLAINAQQETVSKLPARFWRDFLELSTSCATVRRPTATTRDVALTNAWRFSCSDGTAAGVVTSQRALPFHKR